MTLHRLLDNCEATWVVDIGNSGIKIALADCGPSLSPLPVTVFENRHFNWQQSAVRKVWQATWSHADLGTTAQQKTNTWPANQSEAIVDLNNPTWPELVIAQALKHFDISPSVNRKNGWLLSTVHRQAALQWSKYLAERHPHDIAQIFESRQLAWPLKVDYPDRVGTDRVLAAWSAWNVLGKKAPCVVIQAGTAITVDGVDEDGQFAGGAILPGLRLTLNALAGGTDLLPRLFTPASPLELPSLPGKNTEAAMLAGGVAAVVGGINHLLKRYRELWGEHVPIILSGGHRAQLSPLLAYPVTVIDHLVLLGLCGFLDSICE